MCDISRPDPEFPRLDAARARLVLRDLERLLAEQPEADVVLEWLGALRREAHEP